MVRDLDLVAISLFEKETGSVVGDGLQAYVGMFVMDDSIVTSSVM